MKISAFDSDVTAWRNSIVQIYMLLQCVIISPLCVCSFMHYTAYPNFPCPAVTRHCRSGTLAQRLDDIIPSGGSAGRPPTTPGTRGDAAVFVLTFGEQVDDTMVDRDRGCEPIEMEMWGCLRFTVGMTGVSSAHLTVAAAEIRKPSDVLRYTHLNGSCNRWAMSGCL